jgi:uncharacterized protein
MTSAVQRLMGINWNGLAAQLDERGYALTQPLLSEEECNQIARLYGDQSAFRHRVVMQRHGFGRGEYKYFADPLPSLVQDLREQLYPAFSEIANRWAERLNQTERFPSTLAEFLDICRGRQQKLPTPLILRYETGDYNCLHQDVYGEIGFPLQAACVLSRHGRDYTGGEFLLTEQRPRTQTRGEAITVEQGEFIIFANRWRPVAGARGYYRVNTRHGVSRLRSGERYCLGLIFHNAAK